MSGKHPRKGPNPALMTDAECDRVAELIEQGRTHAEIAALIGKSKGSVSWAVLKTGAVGPRTLLRTTTRVLKPYERNGRVVRPFSQSEDDKILELEGQGLPRCKIGRLLGRNPRSIKGRLYTLARHQEAAE